MRAEPVLVLFVGGTEVQARYVKQIERSVRDRHGGGVRVEWFLTGWTGNWIDDAKRIEAKLPGASVLILMSFVRTMLGRRLRRAAGRAQVPWVACTGHGRAALEDAIDRAVQLAGARHGA